MNDINQSVDQEDMYMSEVSFIQNELFKPKKSYIEMIEEAS